MTAHDYTNNRSLFYTSPTNSTGSGVIMVDFIEALREGQEVRERTILQLIPVIEKTAQVIIEALRSGRKILVFGNGGSAAEAQHFVGELVGRYKAERRSLAAIALSTDTSVLTCISNDYSYEEVFARQLYALAQAGDVAIGLTTSGRSANVLRGFQAAGECGAVTIALAGQHGLQDAQTDYGLAVPSLTTARIQEEHLAIIHCWCDAIDAAFVGG
jgi:D-sedoheptulose 7-phosphate isomerase